MPPGKLDGLLERLIRPGKLLIIACPPDLSVPPPSTSSMVMIVTASCCGGVMATRAATVSCPRRP